MSSLFSVLVEVGTTVTKVSPSIRVNYASL